MTALALAPGVVYVGFTDPTGEEPTVLAALDATSGAMLGWNPSLLPIPSNDPTIAPCLAVSALAVAGNTVYVSGCFLTTGTNALNSFAAFDSSTGTLLPGKLPPGSHGPAALAAVGDTLYAGGDQFLYAYDAASSDILWQAPPGAAVGSAVVSALLPEGGTLYVGGSFSQIGGVARGGLAALEASSGAVLPWYPQLNTTQSGLQINGFALSGSTIYVGTSGNVYDNSLFAIDSTTGALWP